MYLYICTFSKHSTLTKIGFTSNFCNRQNKLVSDFGRILDYHLIPTHNARALEKELHSYFKSYRKHLLKGVGKTEFFQVSIQRCLDYLAGKGCISQGIPEDALESIKAELYRLDKYRAVTKLHVFLKSVCSRYVDLPIILQDEDFFFSFSDLSQEIILEFI